jgi:hypothetical protein
MHWNGVRRVHLSHTDDESLLLRLELTDTGALSSQPIAIPMALEYGQDVFVASDGAIHVQRRPPDLMTFHKFTATGELEWTIEETAEHPAAFAGFAEDAAGAMFGGFFHDGAMEAVRFTATGLEVLASVEYEAFGQHFSSLKVREFSLLSSDTFIFGADAGSDDYGDPMVGIFQDGAAVGEYITGNGRGSISSIIVEGTWVFVGHGSHNFNNVYTLALERFDWRLTPHWKQASMAYVESYEWQSRLSPYYRRTPLAKVSDRLVFGTSLRELTTGGRLETLQVYDLDGTKLGDIPGVGPVRSLVPAGPDSVFVVWSDRIDYDREVETFVSLIQVP